MSLRAVVTGGAGYIGAHMARLLLDQGYEVIIIDNLSTGHRSTVDTRAHLHQINLCNMDDTRRCLLDSSPDIVFHFAALSLVSESMEKPWRYFSHNLQSTIHLLQAMRDANCRKLVYSSSCAIFGIAQTIPIAESHPQQPLSPYGQSKAICENLIDAATKEWMLDAISLRYFNVAGCGNDDRLREQHDPETHLIPNLLKAAGTDKPFSLYGTTHPTPDGTAIRDYIHVQDLVEAHLLAGNRLLSDACGFRAFNLGSGCGYSVREVLKAAETVTHHRIDVIERPARAGDPSELLADPSAWLQWTGHPVATCNLQEMVTSAWQAMHADMPK